MKLLRYSTRDQIRRRFDHTEAYAFVKAVSEPILRNSQAFPLLRCPIDEMFYETFCIVDKLLFSKKDVSWHDAFVQGVGEYEKRLVDEDRDGGVTQEERHRLVFLILLNASFVIHTLPESCSARQYSFGLMDCWRQYVTPDFSKLCYGTIMRNETLAVSLQQFMASYASQSECYSMQIDKLMRETHDDEYLHGYRPIPEDDIASALLEDKVSVDEWQQKPVKERVMKAISIMKGEKCPGKKQNYFDKHKLGYQYAYIYLLMNERYEGDKIGLPFFEKERDFLDYLGTPCSLKTIRTRVLLVRGKYPGWKILDKSQTDVDEAKCLAKRFLSIYTKGPQSY